MKTLLNIWNSRNLSLKGRITILKSLILPQILLNLIYVPVYILDQINEMFFKFLWRNKAPKIRKDTIVAPIELGGLKMVDVYSMHTAAKISWIKRLCTNEDTDWKLLFYKMLSLEKNMLNKKVSLIISDFLWEGKARVARSYLERDINEGGLKLTNVKLFNCALKLTWVKRILGKNGNWQTIFQANFNTMNKKFYFELDIESLKSLQGKCSNIFWKDVIAAWMEYKMEFHEKIDPRTFPIWDTYYITNTNLIKRSWELQNVGIKYLNDVISPTGGLLGYDEFIRTFNLQMNFVDFYSLMHSIPRKWKGGLNERLHKTCIHQEVLESLLKMRKVCKESYSYMLSKNFKHRSHETKWCQVLQPYTVLFPWHKYYSMNFQCTLDSKMRAFQYKILLRIIPTNKYLKLCKITDNDNCYFCDNDIETIEHLFYFCPIVKAFWDKLAEKTLFGHNFSS